MVKGLENHDEEFDPVGHRSQNAHRDQEGNVKEQHG